jgi:hypothetical protein
MGLLVPRCTGGGIFPGAHCDSSNSTGNNPDRAPHQLGIYTAAVPQP